MVRKLVFSLFALFAFLQNINAQSTNQERIYMPLFEVINLAPEYQYSSSRLLKTYIDDQEKYLLVLPDKPASGLYPVEDPAVSAKKATALNANYYMVGSLNHIGEKIVVTVTLYNLRGKKLWSDRLTAISIEDIDPVLQRIARNTGTNTKAFDDADIYTVTTPEQRELERAKANYAFGVCIGGIFPFNYKDDVASGGGLIWSYDVRNMLIEINTQMYFGLRANIYSVSLHGFYPFSPKKITPFLGGGLGLGATTFKSEKDVVVNHVDWLGQPLYSETVKETEHITKTGLMLMLGGGYMFNRMSNVSFRIGGYFFKGFYDTGGYNTIGGLVKVDVLFSKETR